MDRLMLDSALDRFFHRKFSASYLKEVLRIHESDERRLDAGRRRESLLAQQKALLEKRERIIEFALDGVYPKAERDRRLGMVDGDLEVSRQALDDVRDTRFSYKQFMEMMRPFREFELLPVDEKRRLITSRFQEIKVKDYRVVSFYLLTGEAATLNAERQAPVGGDAAICYDCRQPLAESLQVDPRRNYCRECWSSVTHVDGPKDLGGLHPGVFGGLESNGVLAFNDSHHRL